MKTVQMFMMKRGMGDLVFRNITLLNWKMQMFKKKYIFTINGISMEFPNISKTTVYRTLLKTWDVTNCVQDKS